MRCIGRNIYLNRCKNNCNFLVCEFHRLQLLMIIFISIPTIFWTYIEISLWLFPGSSLSQQDINNLIEAQEKINNSKKEALYQAYNESKLDRQTTSNQIQLDLNHTRIISAYENKNITKLSTLIDSVYQIKTDDLDKIKGYVIASYFTKGEYLNACNLVMQRDSIRFDHNHSLKLDAARTIRYYSKKHGREAGIELTDSLIKKYSTKIISPLWTTISYYIVHAIEQGKHDEDFLSANMTSKVKEQVRTILADFPDDPYCSYGYYVLGEYENALQCNKGTRIKDVIIYAQAIQLLKQYRPYDFHDKRIKLLDSEVNESLELFYSYFEDSNNEKLPHFTNSIYYAAWLHAHKKEYKNALRLIKKYSDKATSYRLLSLKNSILIQLSNTIEIDSFSTVLDEYYKNERNYISANFLRKIAMKTNHSNVVKFIQTIETNEDDIIKYLDFKIRKQYLDNDIHILIEYLKESKYSLNTAKYINEYYLVLQLIKTKNFKQFLTNLKKLNRQVDNDVLLRYVEEALLRFKIKNQQYALSYIEIRKLINEGSFNRAQEKIEKFLEKYPNKDLTDDIIAEAIYINFESNRPLEGLNQLNDLILKFPKSNAIDNSFNTIANYYQKGCCCDSYERANMKTNCKLAIQYSQYIIDDYNISSYGKQAEKRIVQCRKTLRLNNNRNSVNN